MAYIFSYFIGENVDGEQIFLSVSKDGLHWEDLNHGKPVIVSHVGDEGLRDPFLIRKHDGSGFVMIATDLRIANGQGWEAAKTVGSRNLAVMESADLVHWSEPVLVEVGVEGAGCVWAPEAIYEEEKDDYLVFWASNITLKGETERKQRIYAARTTDFHSFGEPFVFLERENHVIDTTMAYEDGYYYRFSKDETIKTIRVDRGTSLDPDCFEAVEVSVLQNLFGVEGPEIYWLKDRSQWCLIVDRFATDGGYLPLLCSSLSACDFRILEDSEFDMGMTKKRHGGVIEITDEEYETLKRDLL
ncbi:MAG: glycoside hydrolase family 43 protein [Lachnospiraceae bacterium]|nr:glycoside hydrolase family 43 protein [Lachnospiraceae bacterium]